MRAGTVVGRGFGRGWGGLGWASDSVWDGVGVAAGEMEAEGGVGEKLGHLGINSVVLEGIWVRVGCGAGVGVGVGMGVGGWGKRGRFIQQAGRRSAGREGYKGCGLLVAVTRRLLERGSQVRTLKWAWCIFPSANWGLSKTEIHFFGCLSVYLSVCLPVCLSLSLSVRVSVCLSA